MCKRSRPKSSNTRTKQYLTMESTCANAKSEDNQVKSDTIKNTCFEKVDTKAQSGETTFDKTQEENVSPVQEVKKSRYNMFTKLLQKSKENAVKGSGETIVKFREKQLKIPSLRQPLKASSAKIISHTVYSKGIGAKTKLEVQGINYSKVSEEFKKPVVTYAQRKIDKKRSRQDPQYQTLFSVNNEWESDADGFSVYANVVDATQSIANWSIETDKTQTIT